MKRLEKREIFDMTGEIKKSPSQVREESELVTKDQKSLSTLSQEIGVREENMNSSHIRVDGTLILPKDIGEFRNWTPD